MVKRVVSLAERRGGGEVLSNEMIGFIGDVNMSNGHKGLGEIALASRPSIDVATLKPGQFVGFINSKANAVKLFATNNIVIHRKLVEGHIESKDGSGLMPVFMSHGLVKYRRRVEEALLSYVANVLEQQREKARKAREKAEKKRK